LQGYPYMDRHIKIVVGTNKGVYMRWLAFRVVTGKEYNIREKIKKIDANAEIWIPRKYYVDMVDNKVKDKSERMLPGYILMGTEKPLNLFSLSDSIKIVGEITEEEITVLKAQEGSKKEYLEVGSRVMVLDGPFSGCKGRVTEHKEDNIKCTIAFHGIDLEASLREDLVCVLND